VDPRVRRRSTADPAVLRDGTLDGDIKLPWCVFSVTPRPDKEAVPVPCECSQEAMGYALPEVTPYVWGEQIHDFHPSGYIGGQEDVDLCNIASYIVGD